MYKAEARQVLTSLSAVAWSTLAHIVAGTRNIHADTMLAVMLLAGTCLRVHLCNHWLNLAELSSELCRTFTCVLVDPVNTGAAILAHVVVTVVYVYRTVLTTETLKTVACVVRNMFAAFPAIFAWILRRCTEGDFLAAVFALETRLTFAFIVSNFINTGGIVHTPVGKTVIYISLASNTFKSLGTITHEPASLQDLAHGAVDTWISVAGIYHLLALFPVEARRALAMIIPVREGVTFCPIVTRICVA